MSGNPSYRLSPLPDDQWSPQLELIRDSLGTVLNVHRVMAHHPDLLQAWSPLRGHVVAGSTLEPRLREMVILRVAHHTRVAYEWHHHVVRGGAAGLSDAEIDAIRTGSQVWTEREAVLLRAVDELISRLGVGEETWVDLIGAYSTEQILDLIVTVGTYVTLAMLINTTGVEIEESSP